MEKNIRYRLRGTGGPQEMEDSLISVGFKTRKDVDAHIKAWHLQTIKGLALRIEKYELPR